ncbi:MAG TPA: carboxypeptidase regulatory-like domain-containing protein [Caulifigura sp.]|nr:carboxypeptidase regulatory-like domain-containing protein [Caulifigura sp.]
MRHVLLRALVPLTLAMFLAPATSSAAEPAASSKAVIKGKVTDRTGQPIAEAVVRVAIPAADMRFIDSSSRHQQPETRTGPDGSYSLEVPGLTQPTKVSLDAMKPGYRRLVGTLMSGGDVTDLSVTPGKEATANLSLDPAQYFKGVVVDEEGHPIPGVRVSGSADSAAASGGIERTATNKDGAFEIFNYPIEPPVFADGKTKGAVSFDHPDYINHSISDVYTLPPLERITLWIVLKSGFRLSGKVLDAAGKPVSKVMVRALAPGDYENRKAILTDAAGQFELIGLKPGARQVTVFANDIEQKGEVSLAVTKDVTDLVIKLKPMPIKTPPKTFDVLGMQLTDLTPELSDAFGLHHKGGALIMDPGSDSNRLKIGELSKGYYFWLVGDSNIDSVRQFVEQIIKEADRSAGRKTLDAVAEAVTGEPPRIRIRVVYALSTLQFDGTNTQYLDLSQADIDELKKLLPTLPKP